MPEWIESALVLLADDNPDDQSIAARAIRKTGLPVSLVGAFDGQHALELLGLAGDEARQAPIPSLVILDIKMPRVSGIEVLRAIRADRRFDGVPVLMLTSSAEERDVEECRSLGADSYLQKPLEYEQFLQVVSAVVSHWLTESRVGAAPKPRCLFTEGRGATVGR